MKFYIKYILFCAISIASYHAKSLATDAPTKLHVKADSVAHYEQTPNSRMSISCNMDGGWYVTKTILSGKEKKPQFEEFVLRVRDDIEDIIIYKKNEINNRFVKANLPQKIDSIEAYKYAYENGFFQVNISCGGFRIIAWISENDVIEVTYNRYRKNSNTLIETKRLNLKLLEKRKAAHSLSTKGMVLASDMDDLLQFRKEQYGFTNCGIHSLLVSVVMMHPEKLKVMLNKHDLVAQLEDSSIPNNQVRIEKALKILFASGALSAAYGLQTGLGQDLMATMATWFLSSDLNPSLEFQKFFRKKAGIMPEKMVSTGNVCLKLLDLETKHQVELKKENNIDKLKANWKEIIDGGSPIIALLKRESDASLHYLVIYAISENNNFYYWDLGGRDLTGNYITWSEAAITGQNFFSEEELEAILDCFRSNTFKVMHSLAGIDARFNYLHFTNTNSR